MDNMGLLTKSSSEKMSRFLCPDYDGIARDHPFFKTLRRTIFRKPTLSTVLLGFRFGELDCLQLKLELFEIPCLIFLFGGEYPKVSRYRDQSVESVFLDAGLAIAADIATQIALHLVFEEGDDFTV